MDISTLVDNFPELPPATSLPHFDSVGQASIRPIENTAVQAPDSSSRLRIFPIEAPLIHRPLRVKRALRVRKEQLQEQCDHIQAVAQLLINNGQRFLTKTEFIQFALSQETCPQHLKDCSLVSLMRRTRQCEKCAKAIWERVLSKPRKASTQVAKPPTPKPTFILPLNR